MIDINEVITFFDDLAYKWDNMEVKNEDVINIILDNAKVMDGHKVLDVACGTGIMIPYYLKRNVSNVNAVDISPNMISIASKKFVDEKRVEFTCCDVEKCTFEDVFDNIVVYNAFPHFQSAESLIECLSDKLKEGGTLTVAHGMSREKIDAHHKNCASHVSNGLMEADKLAEIFSKYLDVTTIISNDDMYQVVGFKR